MWLLLSIVIVLILLLGLILWSPMLLCVDSTRQQYYFQWQGIGRVDILPLAETLLLRLRIFWWKKDIDLLHPQTWKTKEKEDKKAKAKKKSGRKKSVSIKRIPRRLWRVLQSFQVQTFRLHLDTDSVVQNAYLYPVFFALRSPRRDLQIRYDGESLLVLRVRNRIIRMLRAFVLG